MYTSFFNLTEKPFELLPNPKFLFLSKGHKKALSYLEYGIQERAGFTLLTGDVGSGKTVVALFAALAAVANKCQVAIMAPTEILANQHFISMERYLKGTTQ